MFGRKREKLQNIEPEPPVKSGGENFFDASVNWEAARIYQIERSERRAWTVAIVAVLCAVLPIAAIVLMLPLKENTPYVIRVDNATGVPDIVTALDHKTMKFDDVMDKYWLAQYVRAHETYDWFMIQKDYNTVGLLSSPRVAQEYGAYFEGKEALDKRYGNSIRVTVEITSVVPNGKGMGTVRFVKTVKRVDDLNSPGTVTKWVATVAYEYRKPSLIRESARLINPFGFQVLSYRVDSEMEAVQ